MNLRLVKNIDRDDELRRSFDELARSTFDISFEAWHDAGWWTDRYRPYALAEGRRVLANASVNLMSLVRPDGQRRNLLQLGTVMTDPARRNQGLARRLMETILEEWTGRVDGFFLFANDSVLDFYPKFGFERRPEYQYWQPWTRRPAAGGLRRLDLSLAADVELLRRLYQGGNPWSALSSADNFGLLMFYGLGPLKDFFRYSEALDAVFVAAEEDGELLCFEALGRPDVNLTDLLSLAAGPATTRLTMGFTPIQTDGWLAHPLAGDEALFVRGWSGHEFLKNKLRFPLLSHA